MAKAVKNQTSETAIDFLENEVFYRHSVPSVLISDSGTHFTSDLFERTLKNYGIEHRKSPIYYPQANGLVERANSRLIQSIRILAERHRRSWPNYVQIAVMQWNRAVSETTSYSPHYLLHGYVAYSIFERRLRLKIIEEDPSYDSLTEARETLESARKTAIKNITKAEERWNRYRGRHVTAPPIKVKDFVYAENTIVDQTVRRKQKPLKIGPYLVIKRLGETVYAIVEVKKIQRF